jgi:hypothetical protein
MGQQNISSGMTPLKVSNITTILQTGDADYLKPGVDFLTPYMTSLPAYAKAYSEEDGNYYRVPVNSSAPTVFPTAQTTTPYGKTYDIPLPTDCIDDGVESIEIWYGASSIDRQVLQENITKEQDETAWDLASAIVLWRNAGRKIRIRVNDPISSSANLSYQLGYVRFPTYPTATGDDVDIPAEDVDTFIDDYYKPSVIKV